MFVVVVSQSKAATQCCLQQSHTLCLPLAASHTPPLLCSVCCVMCCYTADDTKTAQGMLDFLLAWYERFPQYRDHELYLAGQSYAGAVPGVGTMGCS